MGRRGEGWWRDGHDRDYSTRAGCASRALAQRASGNLPCLALPMPGFAHAQSCPKPSVREPLAGSHPHARQASLSGCEAGTPHPCCAYLECCLKPTSLTCPIFSCLSFKYPSLEHRVSEMYRPQLSSHYRMLSHGLHSSRHCVSTLIALGQCLPKPAFSLCY